jgi:outer membrane protein assembly factor BamB
LDFFVYALDANTGAVRWKYETGLGVSSPPSISGEVAVIGSKDGYLYALEIGTAKLLWKVRAGEVITGPVVFGDSLIYLQSWGLQAHDAASGKMVWRAGLGGGVQNAPVIAGRTMYLTSGGGDVYALE